MELYDEQVVERKKSKMPMIIGICIAVLLIITILIIGGIIYLKNSITTIQIDGKRNYEIEEILYVEKTQEGLELYIPIIKMSQILGYEGFTGDYKDKSEDKTKCHVTCENEIAMFTKDSNILVKITEGSEYEYIELDKAVFEKDGELYTTIDGMENAFNILFSADNKFKNINIYTMEYLVNYYATTLKIEKYSTDFTDKKAIFQDMLIIEENEQYGVKKIETINNLLQANAVLEAKYQEIKYLPATTDFLVKSNGKYGVVAKDATIKIRTVYDEIKIIDNRHGLYLVKQNNAFGIVNTNGEVIIEPEYQQIGIGNVEKYAQNGVENQYILLDEIIPIKNKEGLWGFFNIEGEKITDFKYTSIGCEITPASNSYPAVVIPSYKVIVALKDKYYNLVTIDGEELITVNIVDSVYLKTNTTTEQNQFFMTSNNYTKVINVEEWLTSIGR